MKIQETLYLLILGHGQMHTQRGVVCMKGIILLIYKKTPNKNCRDIYEETENNSTKPSQSNSLI